MSQPRHSGRLLGGLASCGACLLVLALLADVATFLIAVVGWFGNGTLEHPGTPSYVVPMLRGSLIAAVPLFLLMALATGIAKATGGKPSPAQVALAALDQDGQARYTRAVGAVQAITGHGAHSALSEGELSVHLSDIATQLQRITALRAVIARRAVAAPGPELAAVLAGQRQAVAVAVKAVEDRVQALETYATQLQAVSAAKADWEAAMSASADNDLFRDLVTSAEADRLASADIGHAAATTPSEQHYREVLRAAALTAEALTPVPEPRDAS